MLGLELHELADACSGRAEETHYEVPEPLLVVVELVLKKGVIRIADDILQKLLLLQLVLRQCFPREKHAKP